MRPYFEKKKKKSQKRVGGEAQGVGPAFKPQYQKKKNFFYFKSNDNYPTVNILYLKATIFVLSIAETIINGPVTEGSSSFNGLLIAC
jgi:hypothetical protein